MVRLVLLRFLESYFRHRWLYLLPIVVMSGVAAAYVATMPATYVVTGTLYIQNGNLLSSLTAIRNDGFSYITPAQATVGELYQLLNAKAFLRAVVQKSDLEGRMNQSEETAAQTISEAKDAIWVQELGSNLVMVGAEHEMPRIAQQLADATIETYTQWKINLNREESVAAQNFFVDLIKTYRAEVEPARENLNGYLRSHPRPLQGDRPDEESTEIDRLQAALRAAEDRLQRAENQEESARLALAQAESTVRQSYFVVDAPTRPLAPERSKKEMALMFALFVAAGFALSVTGIVGGALLDDSLRFPIDVLHGLNLPVLTMIPHTSVKVKPSIKGHYASAAPPKGWQSTPHDPAAAQPLTPDNAIHTYRSSDQVPYNFAEPTLSAFVEGEKQKTRLR